MVAVDSAVEGEEVAFANVEEVVDFVHVAVVFVLFLPFGSEFVAPEHHGEGLSYPFAHKHSDGDVDSLLSGRDDAAAVVGG